MPTRTVVIFEDITTERDTLYAALTDEFGPKAVIVAFNPTSVDNNLPYEDQIINYFKKQKVSTNDIALIITDRDLSRYDKWGGLSESVISNIADEYAIPICLYAREDRVRSFGGKISQISKWSDYKIILDIEKGLPEIARESLRVFEAFENIRDAYHEIMRKRNKPASPAEILSCVLGKPELMDRIALYGAGDQHVAQDLFPYTSDVKAVTKRIPRLLGYWLWDSILRYPGIFVSGNAAASYLNISPVDFVRPEVLALFRDALFSGPFSGIKDYWWRKELDNLVYSEGCADGHEFVTKKGIEVNACTCSVDQSSPAGYYCMITELPICEQHSKSNISWFPAGADLARISKPQYDKLAPWIGLY